MASNKMTMAMRVCVSG